MGCYGHWAPKLSYVVHNTHQSLNLEPAVRIAENRDLELDLPEHLRHWAKKLWRPLTKERRERLKLSSHGVVVKKKKANGQYSVRLACITHVFRACLGLVV